MIFNAFTFVYAVFTLMAIGAGAIFLFGPVLVDLLDKRATYRCRDSAAAGVKQSPPPLEQLRLPNGGPPALVLAVGDRKGPWIEYDCNSIRGGLTKRASSG